MARDAMKHRGRQALFTVMGFLAVALVASITVGSLRASAFRRWVAEDGGRLEPYAVIIAGEGAPDTLDPIDRDLLQSIGDGRLVASMSRSDYWQSLTRRTVWTKVHLVTLKPGEEDVRIPIKMLVRMERRDGQWRVKEEETLALP